MLEDANVARAAPHNLQAFSLAPANDRALDVSGLIELILTRYHETHRREFPEAIRLARKVEAVHSAEPECPRGLADHLAFMADDLESHQRREEQVLFPMMLGGGSPMIHMPIGRMVAEHRDVEDQLARLRVLTHDHVPPPGSCATWQALSQACRKLDEDLCEHMRLENEVLFQRFLD
jgi:regulator of cell morphogenesis and NO signaling